MKQFDKKTILMKYIEMNEGVPIEELLQTLYIEKEMSIQEVADKLGAHYHTVASWLKQIEIETRLPHQKLLELIEIKKQLEGK